MLRVLMVRIFCLDIKECSSNPCANNGTCIDLINDYSCICAAGYTGKNCTIGTLISYSFFLQYSYKLIGQLISYIFTSRKVGKEIGDSEAFFLSTHLAKGIRYCFAFCQLVLATI